MTNFMIKNTILKEHPGKRRVSGCSVQFTDSIVRSWDAEESE